MIIALLTDFGTADYFVGAMKGAILVINREARIVDITHEIAAQNIRSAAFTLRACYQNFPAKTVFVAVVDPGVGSSRRAIVVEAEKYQFVAPDNGLLSFAFDETADFKVYELTNQKFFAQIVSRTFHGRDIFAPVAAHLSKGVSASQFGAEIKDYVHLPDAKPQRISETIIEAEIVHIDRFGNLVTNLRRADLPESFTLTVGAATVNVLREFFAESSAGELFLIEGSTGFIEIAAFKMSAADLLKIETGAKLILNSV